MTDDTFLDVVYKVYGDCVHAWCGYQLYGALTVEWPEIREDFDIRIAGFEGEMVRFRRLLVFDGDVRLRVRCTMAHLEQALRMAGVWLHVGHHSVQMRAPVIEPLRPSSTLWAGAAYCRHTEGDRRSGRGKRKSYQGRELVGQLSGILGRRCDASPRITLGRKVRLQFSGKRPDQCGQAVMLEGLSAEQSLAVQRERFARCHMGGSVFQPGPLPRWLQRRRSGRRGR